MADDRRFLNSLFAGSKARLIAKMILIASLSFSVKGLHAQTYGEVTGRVTDVSGAVMRGASITLTNVNTNGVRQAAATDAGVYTFPSVPPGSYTLKTEVSGFKKSVSDPFQVQVQQTVRLDIVLQVGQTNETVEVAATANLLQAETATLGT